MEEQRKVETIAALSQVPVASFREERVRAHNHREHFRLHLRSAKQSRAQTRKLVGRWLALPAGVQS